MATIQINLRKLDGNTITLDIPRNTTNWGQVYTALGDKFNINPKTKTIILSGESMEDGTPF